MANPRKRKRSQVDQTVLCDSTDSFSGPFTYNKHRHQPSPIIATDRDTTDNESTRRKRHPSVPPPQFWDNLSIIPLTTSAVEELERRNIARQNNHYPAEGTGSGLRRSCRLIARRAAEEAHQLELPAQSRLKRYSSQGGPDLTDLRGYRLFSCCQHEMRSSSSSLGRRKRGSHSPEKSSTAPTTTSTKSTGPYDRAFGQHLVDNSILPDRYKHFDGRVPPRTSNIKDIRQALGQPRSSLSPSQFSEQRFEDFQQAQADASKESQVIADVFPFIEGNIRDKKCVGRQVPFTNLDHLTDGTLVAANPDIYHGARPEQLQRKLRDELSGQILPSTQQDLPIAPNFFVEVKGPDGSAAVAQRQINYYMALGERGQVALDSLGNTEPIHDNKAHTLGCTYLDGTLKLYATAMLPSEQGAQAGYTITQLKAFAMTSDYDAFREGAAAYRNAADWSKWQRDQAIEKANNVEADREESLISQTTEAYGLGLALTCQASHNVDEADVAASIHSLETSRNANKLGKDGTPTLVRPQYDPESADELSLDYEPPAKRSYSPQKQQGEQLGNDHQPPAKGPRSRQKQQERQQKFKPK